MRLAIFRVGTAWSSFGGPNVCFAHEIEAVH
jgi:hypothetical protein